MQPYMTINDLASHFNVSISTIRNWVRAGSIPATAYIKVSTTYRFNVSKVEAALLASDGTPHVPVTEQDMDEAGAELDELTAPNEENTREAASLDSILSDYEDDI